MGIAERKLRQKEELRNTIIQEARRLMKEDGCETLSIRKIADAIEYSVPVVYEHFQNKDALLHEFVKEGFLQLTQQLKEAMLPFNDPADKLRELGKAYWDFAFANKEHYQLMFGLGIPSCDMVRQLEEVGRFSGILLTVIRELRDAYGSDSDVFLKFHALWSTLHGLVSINLLQTENHNPEMNQLVLKDVLEVFIKGMR